MRLADRILAVIEERDHWLRSPPLELPSWARETWDTQFDGRVAAAEKCNKELADAVAMLREHGLV